MPTRHSINNTARGYISYHEKKKMGWGTQKIRYGKDSQIPFGHCCLTLKVAEDPVVSPSGRMYSKEAICKYLLTKVKELKRLRRRYDDQQAELEAKGALISDKKVKQFLMLQDQVCPKDNNKRQSAFEDKKGVLDAKKRKRAIKELSEKTDTELISHKKKEMRRTSYWLPDFTPEAAETLLKKPPKRPSSPTSGASLRMKDLVPCTLTLDPENEKAIICPISKKLISTQKTILIKSTGHVILESTWTQLQKGKSSGMGPDLLACPVTGEHIQADDILHLVASGSSFAASGTVMATKWRPAI